MVTETFRQRLGRILAGTPATMPEPQTRIVSGGTEKNPWARMGLTLQADFKDPLRTVTDRIKAVRLWREIYLKGGPVSEAIDAYPLFALSNGWQLVCEEGQDALKDRVQDWLDQPHVDLDAIMWQGIVDACICGTAFQEIVGTRGGEVWGVVPRDASSFWIDYDATGQITGYQQVTYEDGLSRKVSKIPKDIMLTLTLFPIPGEVYGLSLIGRAYDDIMRDTDMVESLTKAMHRHGTPKHHWDIGSEENPASPADLKEIKKEITNIKAETDFVTTNTRLNVVDTSGITGANEFSNLTLTRLATALGVPEEILGLGRGSTEATATVRHRAFMDKISTIQEIVARTYSRLLIDRITGAPGMVWLEFNDPNPDDEAKKAAWIAQMMQASGMDPFAILPQEWIREQFGISEEEYPVEEQEPEEQVPPTTTPGQLKDFLMNQQAPAKEFMPTEGKGA